MHRGGLSAEGNIQYDGHKLIRLQQNNENETRARQI